MEAAPSRPWFRWLALALLLLLGASGQAQTLLQYQIRIGSVNGVTGGNQTARTVKVGDVITLQLYGVVAGSNSTADEGLQNLYGSVLSNTSGSASAITGALTTVTINTATGSSFDGKGYYAGTLNDVNGDGINDLGGQVNTATSSTGGYFQARGHNDAIQTGGTNRVGNNTEFLLGSLTFTVSGSLNAAGTINENTTATSFTFEHPAGFVTPLQRYSLFQSDGMTKNELSGNIVASSTAVTFSTGATQLYWKGGQGAGAELFSWATDKSGVTNFTTDAAGTNVSGTTPGTATEVIFQASGATNLSTTLDQPTFIRKLTFLSSAVSQVTVAGSSTNSLTIGSGGVESQAGSGNHQLNTDVVLGVTQSWLINATSLTVNGSISGVSQGLNKTGTGTLRLTGTTTNTFSGVTTVSAGQLEARKTGALGGTSALNLVGGTLLLADNNTTAARINSAATVMMNGGTLASERALDGTKTITESLGALTLSSSSSLDFGALGTKGGNTSITFADSSSVAWSGVLTITNWQGGYNGAAQTSQTSDHLFFSNNASGLTLGQVGEIQFFKDGLLYGSKLLSSGEVVADMAIPEPSTIFAGLLLVGAIAWRERRRVNFSFFSVLRRFAAPQF